MQDKKSQLACRWIWKYTLRRSALGGQTALSDQQLEEDRSYPHGGSIHLLLPMDFLRKYSNVYPLIHS